MRKAAATALMLLASLVACASVLGAYVDRLATTPGPLQSMADPLASDPAVRAALPQELSDAIRAQLPQQIRLPGPIRGWLDEAATAVVGAVLEDPDLRHAWLETVDKSRGRYVDQLRAVAAGTADTAAPTLELAPVAELARARLQSVAARWGLQDLVAGLRIEPSIPLPVGAAATSGAGAEAIAHGLDAALHWRWGAGASALLAVAGFLLAGPRTRWSAMAAGGALAAVVGILLLVGAGALAGGTAEGGGLAEAVRHLLLDGLAGQVGGLGRTLVGWGAGVLVAGGVIRVLVGRRVNR